MIERIGKEDYYALLHTKFKGSRVPDFREEHIFMCVFFFYCKNMGVNDPMVGRLLTQGA